MRSADQEIHALCGLTPSPRVGQNHRPRTFPPHTRIPDLWDMPVISWLSSSVVNVDRVTMSEVRRFQNGNVPRDTPIHVSQEWEDLLGSGAHAGLLGNGRHAFTAF